MASDNKDKLSTGVKSWFHEFLIACNMVYRISPILSIILGFVYSSFIGYSLMFVYGFALLHKNLEERNGNNK